MYHSCHSDALEQSKAGTLNSHAYFTMLINVLSHSRDQGSKGIFMNFFFRTIVAFVLASLVHYSQPQTGVVTGASHDTKLPTDQRLDEILRKMTLQAKIPT